MPTIGSMKIDGSKLKHLREGKFISRAELARETGLHRDHIGRLERDASSGSRIENVRKIAEALGVEPPELLRGKQ